MLATDVQRSLVHNEALCSRLLVIVPQSTSPQQGPAGAGVAGKKSADLLHVLYKYSNAVLRKLLLRLKLELYARDNEGFSFEVRRASLARSVCWGERVHGRWLARVGLLERRFFSVFVRVVCVLPSFMAQGCSVMSLPGPARRRISELAAAMIELRDRRDLEAIYRFTSSPQVGCGCLCETIFERTMCCTPRLRLLHAHTLGTPSPTTTWSSLLSPSVPALH